MKPEEIAIEVHHLAEDLSIERERADRLEKRLIVIGNTLDDVVSRGDSYVCRIMSLAQQRDTERARADAAEKEVARLRTDIHESESRTEELVTLLRGVNEALAEAGVPGSSVYADGVRLLAKQRDEAKDRSQSSGDLLQTTYIRALGALAEARSERDKERARARADSAELARDAAIADRNALHKRVGELELVKKEYTDTVYRLHQSVYEHTEAKKERDAAVADLARVRDDLAWSKRLYKDLTEALLPGDNGYLNCMAEVRRLQGVDADLARVREALNVLLREGGKGGAV